ncbi:ribonuclease PH [candidate division WOR-3 bacterium]|nr:ribonuclease PH [candidate division WOR-3 bacterium]
MKGAKLSRKNRKNNELRPTTIKVNYLELVPASTLIKQGDTIVLINTTINDSVPPFLQGSGQGWITAEYAMLPKSTPSRGNRERKFIPGRTFEIQRFIGRSIRQAFDLKKIGEKTILIDCDVIQADGGTRTASITGAFVSVYEILREMVELHEITKIPLKKWIAAVSTGIINDEICLDLDYEEDSTASVDANLVMDEEGNLVEIQCTGEQSLFTLEELNEMVNITSVGIEKLISIQKEALGVQ